MKPSTNLSYNVHSLTAIGYMSYGLLAHAQCHIACLQGVTTNQALKIS